jgi:hypothetical protein
MTTPPLWYVSEVGCGVEVSGSRGDGGLGGRVGSLGDGVRGLGAGIEVSVSRVESRGLGV